MIWTCCETYSIPGKPINAYQCHVLMSNSPQKSSCWVQKHQAIGPGTESMNVHDKDQTNRDHRNAQGNLRLRCGVFAIHHRIASLNLSKFKLKVTSFYRHIQGSCWGHSDHSVILQETITVLWWIATTHPESAAPAIITPAFSAFSESFLMRLAGTSFKRYSMGGWKGFPQYT